jgi:hypothetical protein
MANLRYALLMCGQPRTMEFCYPSQKEHLLNKYLPDVFICTDDQEERMRELYQPKGLLILSQEFIDQRVAAIRADYDQNNLVPPALSVSYKYMRAARMLREQEIAQGWRYDVVFISRFDVAFDSIQPVDAIKPRTIYIPRNDAIWYKTSEEPGIHWGGYSGHLFWMSSEVAQEICNLYFCGPDWNRLSVLDRWEKLNQPWGQNPEIVMKYFIENEGIVVELVEIAMMIIRGTSENPLAFDHVTPISRYPQFDWRRK